MRSLRAFFSLDLLAVISSIRFIKALSALGISCSVIPKLNYRSYFDIWVGWVLGYRDVGITFCYSVQMYEMLQ